MAANRRSSDLCPGYGGAAMSRRQMLTYASNGFGLLAASTLMADDAYAGLAEQHGPHFAPKAKNIIFCYMPGAVSHVDTFDPKPKLDELHGQNQTPDGTRKWKKSPWKFRQHGQSGIPISDVFPHIGDLRRRRLTRGVPQQSLLARFEELLAPPVVEIRVETFAATQRRDALFASQPLQDDPDLLLR